MQPLPRINFVYSKPYYKPHPQEMGPKSFCKGHGRGIKICTYFHKLGHTMKICFKKHGIPIYHKHMNIAQAIDLEANHDDSPSDQPDDNTLDKIANDIIVDQ